MLEPKFWIIKAESDLKLAKKGIKDDDETLDSSIYHTQQCVEKALKGYLVYKNHLSPQKTHDLTMLLKKCIEFDKTFEIFKRDSADLNPYATYFRYPDDYLNIPTRELVEESIKKAQKILNFVKSKIEELESGQKSIF